MTQQSYDSQDFREPGRGLETFAWQSSAAGFLAGGLGAEWIRSALDLWLSWLSWLSWLFAFENPQVLMQCGRSRVVLSHLTLCHTRSWGTVH